MKNIASQILDLHVHLFPERMFLKIWAYFEKRGWRVHRQQVEQIAQTLKAHGVSHAVGLSYPHKTGVARGLNEFMEEVGKQYPQFFPFASVHPDDKDFRDYVDHALASPTLYGFKFQPLVQQFDINDPRLDYLYERCQHSQFPIVSHIGTGPMENPYVGPKHHAKLMARFPELRICVPHMGIPEFDDFLTMLDDFPNMFLDTTMVNVPTYLFENAFTGNRETLLRHADRICFGSDWPNVPYPYQDALDSIVRFGFAPKDVPKVFWQNGLGFLNLKLRPCPPISPEPAD